MKRKKKGGARPTVTIQRVGETGSYPAPARRSSGPKRPSKALVQATGAVATARKAASRAVSIAKAEPMRVGAGVLIGNGLGTLVGNAVHDAALKKPDGYAANNESMIHYGGAVAASAVAIGAAVVGKGTVSRYVLNGAANLASNFFGQASAIARQNAKPLTPIKPVPGTKGTEGDNDPFLTDGGSTGATARRQRVAQRRGALAQRIAERMQAEDPQGAGTEGIEDITGYVNELLEDVSGEVEGMEQSLEEVGVLPLMAAAAAPQLITALSNLLKLASPGGKADLVAKQAQQPVTAAVLELEGEDPSTGASRARELRRERRTLRRDIRKQKRQDRRSARRENRQAKREDKIQADIDRLQEQRQPPMVILQQSPIRRPEQYQEEAPLVILASDTDVEDVSEGLPLRSIYRG